MPKKYGTRAEVLNGDAMMTTGKLTAQDLSINPRGKIVSKRRSAIGQLRGPPVPRHYLQSS